MIKICISVTSHALDPLPLSQTVTPSRTPSPSSVTYFMDGPTIHICIHTSIHTYKQTYTHTYIHTYVHTYIHTNTYLLLFGRLKKLEIVVDFQFASFSKKSTTTGGIKSLK